MDKFTVAFQMFYYRLCHRSVEGDRGSSVWCLRYSKTLSGPSKDFGTRTHVNIPFEVQGFLQLETYPSPIYSLVVTCLVFFI